ncbi:MAG: hypothetical protein GX434_05675 [Peptococcaceae bacterium]|nr:hypothetical protein [Peptococcaceae bacterium]
MLYSKRFSALRDVHMIQEDMFRVNKAAALLHDIGIHLESKENSDLEKNNRIR